MTQPATKTITDKDEIVRLAKEYLKDNSLIDLTGFIFDHCPDTHNHSAFVRDVANKMKRTGQYEIIEQENGQRFLVYPLPPKSFKERYWLLIAAIGFVIGWFGDIGKELYLQKTKQEQTKSEQGTLTKTDTSDTAHVDSSNLVGRTLTTDSITTQNILSQPKIDTVKK